MRVRAVTGRATAATERLIGPVHDQLCPHRSCWTIRAAWWPDKAPVGQREIDARMLGFLARNIDTIRQDEAGPQIARTIRRLRERVEAAIDNRQPDVYYGPCQADVVETIENYGVVTTRLLPGVKCGADLIGELDAAAVTCPDCGSIWDTADLQDWLTEKSRDAWARLSVIVDALRAQGENITLERAKMWVARDKAEAEEGRRRRVSYPPIRPVGVEPRLDGEGRPVMEPLLGEDGQPRHDEDGRPIMVEATRPLFRLGDILGRIEALAAIDEARRTGEGA